MCTWQVVSWQTYGHMGVPLATPSQSFGFFPRMKTEAAIEASACKRSTRRPDWPRAPRWGSVRCCAPPQPPRPRWPSSPQPRGPLPHSPPPPPPLQPAACPPKHAPTHPPTLRRAAPRRALPDSMDEVAAMVHTTTVLPALRPRVCSRKPDDVSATLMAKPSGTHTTDSLAARMKPAGAGSGGGGGGRGGSGIGGVKPRP